MSSRSQVRFYSDPQEDPSKYKTPALTVRKYVGTTITCAIRRLEKNTDWTNGWSADEIFTEIRMNLRMGHLMPLQLQEIKKALDLMPIVNYNKKTGRYYLIKEPKLREMPAEAADNGSFSGPWTRSRSRRNDIRNASASTTDYAKTGFSEIRRDGAAQGTSSATPAVPYWTAEMMDIQRRRTSAVERIADSAEELIRLAERFLNKLERS